MSILVNKLATVMLEADKQYNCNIKETNFEAKNLIWILSLQVITWSKIRLIADDFVSYSKTSSFNQKIVFLSIFISKKNSSILSLIKNIQKFDLQYKQIFNQFYEKLKKNFSFVLHKNKILKKMNCVYIFH